MIMSERMEEKSSQRALLGLFLSDFVLGDGRASRLKRAKSTGQTQKLC